MTLPNDHNQWPADALFELEESAYIKAEQRNETTPSPETWRLAEMGVRQRWERR